MSRQVVYPSRRQGRRKKMYTLSKTLPGTSTGTMIIALDDLIFERALQVSLVGSLARACMNNYARVCFIRVRYCTDP